MIDDFVKRRLRLDVDLNFSCSYSYSKDLSYMGNVGLFTSDKDLMVDKVFNHILDIHKKSTVDFIPKEDSRIYKYRFKFDYEMISRDYLMAGDFFLKIRQADEEEKDEISLVFIDSEGKELRSFKLNETKESHEERKKTYKDYIAKMKKERKLEADRKKKEKEDDELAELARLSKKFGVK